MKSSKLNRIALTLLFSFPEKKSSLRPHSHILAALIMSLIFIFTFALAGCDVLGNISSAGSKTDYVNDNKEEQQSADDNGQAQQGSQETESQETETTQPEKTTEETQPDQTSEETDAVDPSEQTINVYYSDSMAEYLVGEARTVAGSGKLVDAIYELMKDPIDSSLVVLVPSTTKINSIKVINKIAKVDLSQSFMDDRFTSDTVDILLVYSIVNTLTEFKEVEAVDFYIDGEKLDIFGQLSVEDHIYRRSDLIKTQ